MLIFHENTGLPCLGVDIDKDACSQANKLGYSKIDNVHLDGCLFDYSQAPIIFLASMVSDKKRVLERIAETRKGKKTFINVRTAENLSTLFYEPFDIIDDLPECMKIVGRTVFDNKTINTTYCIEYC